MKNEFKKLPLSDSLKNEPCRHCYSRYGKKIRRKNCKEHYFDVKQRLEYLRGKLRAEGISEGISYGELAELQSLVKYIDPGDIELLEAAGVPEFPEE